MSNQFSFINDIADVAPDMNQAQSGGGGEYIPPAEGVAKAVLVGYIEIGKHDKTGPNAKEGVDQVHLIFELSGAKWPVKTLDDGTKIPQRITVKLTRSLHEKAMLFKLFKRMNYEQTAKHFSQLLGKGYLVTIKHFKPEGMDKPIANLRDDQGNLTIRPPRVETMDEETGEVVAKVVAVPPAVSRQRLFIWDGKPEWFSDMWKSVGEYYQKLIREAKNFEGSPVCEWLISNGEPITPPAKDEKAGKAEKAKPAEATDADDVLNGME